MGINHVIIQIGTTDFEGCDWLFSELRDDLSEEERAFAEQCQSKIESISKNGNQIHEFTMYWVHSNLLYSLNYRADWFNDLILLETEGYRQLKPIENKRPLYVNHNHNKINEDDFKEKIREAIEKIESKSKDEITEEIIVFFKDKNDYEDYNNKRLFDQFISYYIGEAGIFEKLSDEQKNKIKYAKKKAIEKLIPGIFELNNNSDEEMAIRMVEYFNDRFDYIEPEIRMGYQSEKTRDFWDSLKLSYYCRKDYGERIINIEGIANKRMLEEQEFFINKFTSELTKWASSRRITKSLIDEFWVLS